MKISNNIKRLFWDVKKDSLDLEKNCKEIMTRTINYGSLHEWHWLIEQYGKKSISDFLHKTQRNSLRLESKYLAEIIFS